MRNAISNLALICGSLLFLTSAALGQSPSSATPDSATFDADGTAHVTRVVPIPSTISPEARQWLKDMRPQPSAPDDPSGLAGMRAGVDAWRKRDTAEARRLYPVNIETTTTAGVRTDIITPLDIPSENKKTAC